MELTNKLEVSAAHRQALSLFTTGVMLDATTISVTKNLVGGVDQVSLNYTDFGCFINGQYYFIPAGSVLLNAAHVALPAMYYVYTRVTAGSGIVISSTVDPEVDPLVNYQYAWVSIIRMDSPAGTATVYYARRAFTATDLFIHLVGEYDFYTTPAWITGGAITIDAASGEVDIDDLVVRRMRNDIEITGFNDGPILLDNETTVANLELITTYSDGSPITAGKYHKLLFGIIATENGDKRFIVCRQGVPDVEYATRADAAADSEHKTGVYWGSTYVGVVFPIAYIVMLNGDASDLETVDLRPTGVIGSGGGGGIAIGDHSLLANLGVDTHAQYHTNARALAWLATRSSTDLPEGANQYFTTERAQDSVGAALTASNDITPVYDDVANTMAFNFRSSGEGGIVLAAGNNNNIAVGTALLVRVTGPAANFTITGIAGGYAGRVIYIYNTTANNMIAGNEDVLSLAANRILTLGGVPASTTNGQGVFTLVYSATDSRWILTNVHS